MKKICKKCGEEKDAADFYLDSRKKDRLQGSCKPCTNKRNGLWAKDNPHAKRYYKLRAIENKYDISGKEYEAILLAQNNKCAICYTDFEGTTGPKCPCVDHCHDTGKVRAILCWRCNAALGHGGENPEILRRLATYVEDHVMAEELPLHLLTEDDLLLMRQFVGLRPPDLVIADGNDGAYLYRWHIVPRNDKANVYFHWQTASDPARPLHDHPWDNISVILVGGYEEIWGEPRLFFGGVSSIDQPRQRTTKAGDCIMRGAELAHRLVLPEGQRYSMSLFTTGPVIREWGFYCKNGWKPHHECTVLKDNKTYWREGVE